MESYKDTFIRLANEKERIMMEMPEKHAGAIMDIKSAEARIEEIDKAAEDTYEAYFREINADGGLKVKSKNGLVSYSTRKKQDKKYHQMVLDPETLQALFECNLLKIVYKDIADYQAELIAMEEKGDELTPAQQRIRSLNLTFETNPRTEFVKSGAKGEVVDAVESLLWAVKISRACIGSEVKSEYDSIESTAKALKERLFAIKN